ncbi:MAG: AbrB/MazE/SpoVT family DNA-binding domain-containing protein [Sinobacteraceae bacterium]|nr:AbrB/MazE/SpoVT family DNA-binding domain-containing protein [Nevskiaceae bacterium]
MFQQLSRLIDKWYSKPPAFAIWIDRRSGIRQTHRNCHILRIAMLNYTTNLSKEGRVLIPAEVRNKLGLKAGEALKLSIVDGEVHLSRRVDAIRRMQKRLAHLRDPDNPAVDSLLQERREESTRE